MSFSSTHLNGLSFSAHKHLYPSDHSTARSGALAEKDESLPEVAQYVFAPDHTRQSHRDPFAIHDPTASIILRSALERLVATAFDVDQTLLRLPSRGRAEVARARQVAMYLAHTTCGRTKTDVGAMFERDRTTVSHACDVVEDAREDLDFDRALELLEASARLLLAHTILPLLNEFGGKTNDDRQSTDPIDASLVEPGCEPAASA